MNDEDDRYTDKRREEWPELLAAFIESVRDRPHSLARFNCAHFAAGAVEVMTGIDPFRELGITIETDTDARRLIKRGGVMEFAKRFFECEPRTDLLNAGRGDIVFREGVDETTLGICMGADAVFLAEDGIQSRPMKDCAGYWKV